MSKPNQTAPHTIPLMLSLMNCAASTIASNWLKSASHGLSAAESQALNALPEALANLAKKRMLALQKSVHKLEATTRPRTLSGAVIWQKGSARLVDYGVSPALPPLLMIPSLINRAYILDLDKQRSVAAHLARVASPLLLDWGDPSVSEREYDAGAYVREVVVPAIDYVAGVTGQRVHLMGYCMGGVLALGAATLAPDKVASLGLFATPWDFKTADTNVPPMPEAAVEALGVSIAAMSEFPASWVQALFYMQNMEVMQDKYERFADMPEDDPAYAEFVALEQWVNDGVALTRGVALDCFVHWAQHNRLQKGQWLARPKTLTHPTFIAVPKYDQIVPRGSAKALHPLMPHATLVEPDSGHVGMMVGSKAKQQCLAPYAKFLASQHG
jgi:polyhydroxyalkanoate synthase subunit PhaC